MAAFRDVVAAHHRDSDAILVAGREPYITIAREERAKVRGRTFRVVRFDEVEGLTVRRSWAMAVLVCPGDDVAPVARWVLAGDRDPRRVVFYLHPRVDIHRALAPWHREGLQVHTMRRVTGWKQLHKHFGAHWNVRVWDDFRDA